MDSFLSLPHNTLSLFHHSQGSSCETTPTLPHTEAFSSANGTCTQNCDQEIHAIINKQLHTVLHQCTLVHMCYTCFAGFSISLHVHVYIIISFLVTRKTIIMIKFITSIHVTHAFTLNTCYMTICTCIVYTQRSIHYDHRLLYNYYYRLVPLGLPRECPQAPGQIYTLCIPQWHHHNWHIKVLGQTTLLKQCLLSEQKHYYYT